MRGSDEACTLARRGPVVRKLQDFVQVESRPSSIRHIRQPRLPAVPVYITSRGGLQWTSGLDPRTGSGLVQATQNGARAVEALADRFGTPAQWGGEIDAREKARGSSCSGPIKFPEALVGC